MSAFSSAITASNPLFPTRLNAQANDGRMGALVLERYLARTLQAQQDKEESDAEIVLRSIQSLLSFCLNEFAVQTATQCEVKGRLVRKLAEGYERCFTHAMDLLDQERDTAKEDAREAATTQQSEMEKVKVHVLNERKRVAQEKKDLQQQASELDTELSQTKEALEVARRKVSSLGMEVDLYRQECDAAWAKTTEMEARLNSREEEALLNRPPPAEIPTPEQRQEWVSGELAQLQQENAALEAKLEQVTTAVLAGGGTEALHSALQPSSAAADGVSQSGGSGARQGRRGSNTGGYDYDSAPGMSDGGGRRRRPPSQEAPWKPSRSTSPSTPERLLSPGTTSPLSVLAL